jgi:uncharacterized protein (TIGR02145 family)
MDSAGTGIPGAVVKLEQGNLAAITGSDGRFILEDVTAGIHGLINQSLRHTPTAKIHGGFLYVTVSDADIVDFTAFDLNGTVLSTAQRTLDPGVHPIVLPHAGAGVHLYKVKSGMVEIVLKNTPVGGSQRNALSIQSSSKFSGLSKQAKSTAPDSNCIMVKKDGYLNRRIKVTSSDTVGIEIRMIFQDAGTVMDIDSNIYHAIRIGNQVWTVENLRTTKYNDGSAISLYALLGNWGDSTSGKFCYFANTTNVDSIKKYGALYNWYAVQTKKLVPAGWHVPSNAEWLILIEYLIANGYNFDGKTTGNQTAKSLAAKSDWEISENPGSIGNDMDGNNSSGFSAFPCGNRTAWGGYTEMGNLGYWWSSTEYDSSYAYCYSLYSGLDYIVGSNDFDKHCGFSVRFVRD